MISHKIALFKSVDDWGKFFPHMLLNFDQIERQERIHKKDVDHISLKENQSRKFL